MQKAREKRKVVEKMTGRKERSISR